MAERRSRGGSGGPGAIRGDCAHIWPPGAPLLSHKRSTRSSLVPMPGAKGLTPNYAPACGKAVDAPIAPSVSLPGQASKSPGTSKEADIDMDQSPRSVLVP